MDDSNAREFDDSNIEDDGEYQFVDTIHNPVPPKAEEIDFDVSIIQNESDFIKNVVEEMNLKLDDVELNSGADTVQNLLAIIDLQHKVIEDYKMKSLIFIPDREEVRKTMPRDFVKSFGYKVKHIIDCTEIYTEKPHFLDTAAEMWSEYKHHYTVKILISITPQCFIQFVSALYGGRASDLVITTGCGFLQVLKPNDYVLADKGFKMNDEFEMRRAHLELPAFVYRQQQLHPLEIERTRKIANVRIHVERLIGFLKRKFLILHQIIPMTMLSKPISATQNVSLFDKIVTVCAAICNLCPPIV